jgi:DNA-binding MarR family transcriptional regulator
MTCSDCDPRPDAAQDRIGELQHALFRVLRQVVFRNHPNSPLIDLPIAQVRCLHVIARHEGRKMQELADKLEVQLPAMSQIVDRLVKRGMVERHADPSDRRVVRLGLTEAGRVMLDEAHAERCARMTATARHLDDEALRKVIEGLHLLAGAAERGDAEQRKAAPAIALDADPLVEMMARRARSHRAKAAADIDPETPLTKDNP